MPIFALMKVKRKKEYWWMLKVATLEELVDYYKKVELGMWKEGYQQFLERKYLKTSPKHLTNNRAYALMCRWNRVSAQTQRGDKPKTNKPAIVHFAEWIDDMGFNTKLKHLNKYGILYINPVGGFNSGSDKWKEVRTIQKKNYIWPDSNNLEPKIIKWPGGTHYYAKIGNTDVVVDGEQKWGTKEETEEAVQKFLEEEK